MAPKEHAMTQATETTPESQFLSCAAAPLRAHQKFSARAISSVEHAYEREAAIAGATLALGRMHGIELQAPLHIDARGEFSLVVMPPGGGNPAHGTGKYGESFAKILHGHNPRMGVVPGPFVDPSNGWCRINHFDLERMVVEQNERLLTAQALQAKGVASTAQSPVASPLPR
jgi:hypothetical protein